MPISPISSRKNVPPFANSSSPGLVVSAPVNVPFSWPKSSDSRRFSGSDAQSTGTNGRSLRLLFMCMLLATSSLPVPDSPAMSTLVSVPATFSMVSNTLRIGREPPIMLSKPCVRASWERR